MFEIEEVPLPEEIKKPQEIKRPRPHSYHGLSLTVEHKIWRNMRKRCSNNKCKCYHRYGGRGIKVCERWDDFMSFLSDVGNRPTSEHSIERINNDGDYEPNNVYWATKLEQGCNKSNNHFITYGNVSKTLSQWDRDLGFTPGMVYTRLFKLNWTIEKALTTPILTTWKGGPKKK